MVADRFTVLIFALTSFAVAQPQQTCPNGVRMFNCLVNPCLSASCPTGTRCEADYCGGCKHKCLPLIGSGSHDIGRFGCPPGVSRVYCFMDPCRLKKCPSGTRCRSSYCGGCHARCIPFPFGWGSRAGADFLFDGIAGIAGDFGLDSDYVFGADSSPSRFDTAEEVTTVRLPETGSGRGAGANRGGPGFGLQFDNSGASHPLTIAHDDDEQGHVRCPPGQPLTRCAMNPCMTVKCRAGYRCQADRCGGCHGRCVPDPSQFGVSSVQAVGVDSSSVSSSSGSDSNSGRTNEAELVCPADRPAVRCEENPCPAVDCIPGYVCKQDRCGGCGFKCVPAVGTLCPRDDQFRSTSGECLNMGECRSTSDCANPSNNFPSILCVGPVHCRNYRCGRTCGPVGMEIAGDSQGDTCPESDRFLSSSGSCLSMGQCHSKSDCENPANLWPQPRCIGEVICQGNGVCRKLCGPINPRDGVSLSSQTQSAATATISVHQSDSESGVEQSQSQGQEQKAGGERETSDLTSDGSEQSAAAAAGTEDQEDEDEDPESAAEKERKDDPEAIGTEPDPSCAGPKLFRAVSGACLARGFCNTKSDCLNPKNEWARPACVGSAICNKTQCAWICSSSTSAQGQTPESSQGENTETTGQQDDTVGQDADDADENGDSDSDGESETDGRTRVCPPDRPQVYCYMDPCRLKHCPRHSVCESDYCGGCHARCRPVHRSRGIDLSDLSNGGSGGASYGADLSANGEPQQEQRQGQDQAEAEAQAGTDETETAGDSDVRVHVDVDVSASTTNGEATAVKKCDKNTFLSTSGDCLPMGSCSSEADCFNTKNVWTQPPCVGTILCNQSCIKHCKSDGSGA